MRVSLLVLFLLGACSLKKMAVDQTAEVLADGSTAFDTETDLELAAAAIPASLKTMESFLAASPEQRTLLRLVAEGSFNYAFGFLEDEAEEQQHEKPEAAAHLRERAFGLYMRARVCGLRLLALDAESLAAALTRGEMPAAEDLAALSQDELPGLFWTANAWAAAINVRKTPDLVAQLPIVRALIERAAAIDESFYHAGPRMTLGALDAALPKSLGGNPEAAKAHFKQAMALTHGLFLMIPVMYARTVALPLGDRADYESTLKDVLAQDLATAPELALANRLAQARARRYLAAAPDLFIEENTP